MRREIRCPSCGSVSIHDDRFPAFLNPSRCAACAKHLITGEPPSVLTRLPSSVAHAAAGGALFFALNYLHARWWYRSVWHFHLSATPTSYDATAVVAVILGALAGLSIAKRRRQ